MQQEDLIIIGAGPAGLTAAIYAARAGLNPLVFEKLQPGGMMATTDVIENYPGFEQGVNGPELALKIHQQAEKFGARFEFAEVQKLTIDGDQKILDTDTGQFAAKALIIATGTDHRLLGIPGEQEYFGRGVSICGTCDGPLYKGKTTGVVGGGNSAIQEAMFIARFAEKVYIFHRRDKLRADKVLGDRAMATPNIEIVWNTIVTEVIGDDNGVTGLKLHNKVTGEDSELNVDGFFEFIGLIPNNKCLRDVVDLSNEGFIVTDLYGRASVPGIFAAGDIRNKEFRQIATAIADGAQAARLAEEYLGE